MMEGSEAEAMPSVQPGRPTGFQTLRRRFSARLVLLLGLLVFFTAVGIDSLQQAAAADMPSHPLPTLTTAVPIPPQSAVASHSPKSRDRTGTYLEFDETTARRLGRSDLIGSHLTRSRLTSSHLLLQSPR